jgi:hypothetical protein
LCNYWYDYCYASKELKQKSNHNVYDFVLEEDYDDINNEYDRNYFLRKNYELDNYDIGVYAEINYNQLNVGTNQSIGYLENSRIKRF